MNLGPVLDTIASGDPTSVAAARALLLAEGSAAIPELLEVIANVDVGAARQPWREEITAITAGTAVFGGLLVVTMSVGSWLNEQLGSGWGFWIGLLLFWLSVDLSRSAYRGIRRWLGGSEWSQRTRAAVLAGKAAAEEALDWLTDKPALPVIIDALRGEPLTYPAARVAVLTRLLGRVTKLDEHLLNANQRYRLLSLLRPHAALAHPELALAAMHAFGNLGDPDALYHARILYELAGDEAVHARLRAGASACITAVYHRMGELSDRRTLLRAAASPGEEELLRPAAAAIMNEAQLLRPGGLDGDSGYAE